MFNFKIKPFFERTKDGSNKEVQVMPQTTPEAVIGLKPWMDYVDNIVSNITGKKIDGNKSPQFITKGDLENYALKADVDDAFKSSKQYADSTSSYNAKNAIASMTELLNTSVGQLNKTIDDLDSKSDKSFKDIYNRATLLKTFSSLDLNDVMDPGIYNVPFGFTPQLKNGPWKSGELDSGILIVNQVKDDNILQIFISAINAGAVIIRNKSGYPSEWAPWVLASAQK